MKNLLLLFFFCFLSVVAFCQCTITNATSCVCPDGSSDCDLLPDITISWYALQTYNGGPIEFPQTGAGADNGHLRMTGSTPNIGYGPFAVRNIDSVGIYHYVCGTDTFSSSSGTFNCPNGAIAKQILYQRIYHKSGNNMTHRDRIAGAMTPGMHVDDWGIMTLRIQDPAQPDPRNWSIVGTGHKQSFCLMDYGSCSTYNGHCRDDNTVFNQGTILTNTDFPNFGLGNSYGCNPNEQGCSSGWTDIYSESLNGMWIDIPPNTCNGDYWIVYEIDPHDYFQESNETNNYTAIPFTLTHQSAPGNPVITISADREPILCGNDSITLTATAGFLYSWSNGANTQSVKVAAGTYSVSVYNYCGIATASSFTVTSHAAPPDPVVTGASICSGTTATITSTGTNISWYTANNVLAGTGNSYTTPILTSTALFHAQDVIDYPGTIALHGGKSDSIGAGGYFTGVQGEVFDALKPLTIKSVKVYATGAGNRTIQVLNKAGTVIQSGTFSIPNGSSRVNLNFDVPQDTGFQLVATGNPNLFRNNGGVVYPYTIIDTLSITRSTAGSAFYYSFYDWEVEVGGSRCLSTPVTATVSVTTCVGISPVLDLSQNFHVYPNPSSGTFTFDIIMPGSGEDLHLMVFDLTGREVYQNRLKNISGSYSTTIDLGFVSPGVYQLRVEIAGRKYYRKIMIW
ncbi:MAG: T9SS type A sorting domain-containing protein [Bacteroidetes bacterium]|nr:T9SS type A sorting domain-containing protein [Bacteroidota bacterium]